MNSDNAQQRLTFGLAVFVCVAGNPLGKTLKQESGAKKPPEQAAKGKFRSGFAADARIIRVDSRAVKSTLTMLVIGEYFALQ